MSPAVASPAAANARAALARGDLIGAYDCAGSAIAAGEEDLELRHHQVLALARMGDTERAMELFRAHGLDRSPDPHQRAMGARLLKDRALGLPAGEERRQALLDAYEAYRAIHAESGDSFPGINAATLALLAGDEEGARRLAEALLGDEGGDYYSAATQAEASLILGRTDETVRLLRSEPVRSSRDHGARSSTRRQLSLIAGHLGLDEASLLAPLAPPRVAHFCGHMFAAVPVEEARLRAEIEEVLAQEEVGFAYGALACGADLLFAEAVLARGAELHVVLPFAETDFIDQSVRPGGESWIHRYHDCKAKAASVTFASSVDYYGDGGQFGYGSRMAMGLARLRARHLAAEAVQLALWDGGTANGEAGTGADVAAWTANGGRTRILDPGAIDRSLRRPEAARSSRYERTLAAILFTDFAGFSTLSESALPAFWDGVMRRIADILDAHGDAVVCRNSWGDALYAVTATAESAAEIGLQLQDALAELDYSALGLAGGGMRVGVHYGPAYRTIDPITGRPTFYGTEVSKAARIEPITPPGAVFVTQPLAAILALETGDRFGCRYVGRIPLAKNYGDYPMYRLERVGKGAGAGAS